MQHILCSNTLQQSLWFDRPGAHKQSMFSICPWSAKKTKTGELDRKKKDWSSASSAWQRRLHVILIQYPTTAGSVQFCLLCCQPEPVPRSLAARRMQFTLLTPCRLPAWLGRTIHMTCSTCCAPIHSSSPCGVTGQEPTGKACFLLGSGSALKGQDR